MDMSISLQEEHPERRLSVIDQFCILTYQISELQARHFRGIIYGLAFVCVLLLVGLGLAVWRGNGIEQEREALAHELRVERTARISATLAAKDVERNLATDVLDTRVRRDIVDERMVQQAQRSAELEQLAEQVEREKLVEADCVTPRSVLAAKGL